MAYLLPLNIGSCDLCSKGFDKFLVCRIIGLVLFVNYGACGLVGRHYNNVGNINMRRSTYGKMNNLGNIMRSERGIPLIYLFSTIGISFKANVTKFSFNQSGVYGTDSNTVLVEVNTHGLIKCIDSVFARAIYIS